MCAGLPVGHVAVFRALPQSHTARVQKGMSLAKGLYREPASVRASVTTE